MTAEFFAEEAPPERHLSSPSVAEDLERVMRRSITHLQSYTDRRKEPLPIHNHHKPLPTTMETKGQRRSSSKPSPFWRRTINHISAHKPLFLVSLLLFGVLAGAGILVAILLASGKSKNLADTARDLAVERGDWFASQLDYALLPLFTMAQFAVELEQFRSLPNQIGPAYANGSLPMTYDANGQSTWHRNVTGVCDRPSVVERFTEIATQVKHNAGMQGILVNIQLAPAGVVCLLHPLNNTEDFDPPMFLDNSAAWGLDLLEHPEMQYIARQSLKGETIGIAGPLHLTQCPLCDPFFIARLPVLDKNHHIAIDGQLYARWGFATALINWQELVKRSSVQKIFADHHYGFRLTRTDHIFNATTSEYTTLVVVLAESSDYGRGRQRVATALQTTNNEWVLTVEYDEPLWWQPVIITVSLLVSLAISVLVHVVLVQKQAHTQMLGDKQAQHAKVEIERNMTAYFAHELRNPLSAIDSALEAMPEGLPDMAADLVQAMRLCSRFMSSIMNNLLDVRKIEEGKMVLQSVPLSLSQIVDDVHRMTLPALRPGVAFTTEAQTDGCDWVLGDAHRLAQILNNLVMNAIKYTSAGSICLYVGWSRPGRVRFECRDSGPGIPVEEQAELFERFVMRGGAPGSGLGLAISKQIVDLMNGTIAFDSDPTLRPGTTCVIEIPMEVCSEPVDEDDSGNSQPIDEPIRILLIDDIKMNRSMLKRRIHKCIAPNATIEEGSTGEESLRLCGKEPFDVIIMDQFMEGAGGVMLGTDAIIALRRMRVESVIIGCSGNDLDAKFRSAGADLIWRKPMPSNAEIILQLRQTLSLKKRL